MVQQLYLHHTTMNNINFQTDITRVSSENPYKQVYEVSKENSKALLAEIMEYNPDDITIEEEEIGVIVERIYQEGENNYENYYVRCTGSR